mmetsp:Transcript_33854/g.78718  ORF Transcript_33854/g.78718 Transcript_33854/m.78718 type:complete len:218 (+) Transcript_33854:323-976(+)
MLRLGMRRCQVHLFTEVSLALHLSGDPDSLWCQVLTCQASQFRGLQRPLANLLKQAALCLAEVHAQAACPLPIFLQVLPKLLVQRCLDPPTGLQVRLAQLLACSAHQHPHDVAAQIVAFQAAVTTARPRRGLRSHRLWWGLLRFLWCFPLRGRSGGPLPDDGCESTSDCRAHSPSSQHHTTCTIAQAGGSSRPASITKPGIQGFHGCHDVLSRLASG